MKHYVVALVCLILSVNLLGTNERKTVFHPNGYKRFEYEVNGVQLNGLFVGYYETGQVRVKGYLKNNRKTGLWTAWYPNGEMHSQRKYMENDSFQVIHEWDSNGVEIVHKLATYETGPIGPIGAPPVPAKAKDSVPSVKKFPDLYDIGKKLPL